VQVAGKAVLGKERVSLYEKVRRLAKPSSGREGFPQQGKSLMKVVGRAKRRSAVYEKGRYLAKASVGREGSL